MPSLRRTAPAALLSTVLIAVLISVLAVASPPRLFAGEFLPYPVHKKTLANGLDVVVIETPEFAGVVNYNVLILAGSRNETVVGETGLAHLFEHIAFRHRDGDPRLSYRARVERIGAFDNAWTWFDVTYYHPVTFSSRFREFASIQAERFLSLDFDERTYRTEGGAVLGEYRLNASDPSLRIDEVLSDLAYGSAHGYGHTTMGYLADVRNMPETYAAGLAFYRTYYRPNNAIVFVAGDVKADEAFAVIEETHGAWQPGEIPELPEPPPLQGPKKGHVEWDSDVAPRIVHAYRVPAFRPGSKEAAVISIAAELISGRTAPLFQKLRYEKKTVTAMGTGTMSAQGYHSRLLETTVRLEKTLFDEGADSLFRSVEEDLENGFAELSRFSERADAATSLAAMKSKFRFDLLASLASPHDIAATLSWFYRFDRDPDVLDRLVEAVDALEPIDVDAFAKTYFQPANRVVVTMAMAAAAKKEGE